MKKLLVFLLAFVLAVGLMAPVIAQATESGIVEKAATAKPSKLKAAAVDGTSIKLTWKPSGTAGTTYEVQRKSGKKWKSLKVVDATEFTNTGLKKNTKYSYRIRAIQDEGKSAFISASAKTKNPITSLKMSKKMATVKVGSTLSLKATIKPKKATDKVLTWSSSDTTVAKVSSKGKVTPIAAGKATITVTSLNGKTASCLVTVKKRDPKSVSLSKTKVTLYVGDTLQLTGTVKPSDSNATLKWSTSKKAVATVSSTGLVTAKKAGTAKITVKTVNGKKKTCTVTVKKAPEKLGEKDLMIWVDKTLTPIPQTYDEAKKMSKIYSTHIITTDDETGNFYVECEAKKNGAFFFLKFSKDGKFLQLSSHGVMGRNNQISLYRGASLKSTLAQIEAQYGKPHKTTSFYYDVSYYYTFTTSTGTYQFSFDTYDINDTIAFLYVDRL